MPNNNHKKPAQFTESVAYIQSLFQQPETRLQILLNWMKVAIKYVLILLATVVILSSIWFAVKYDFTSISISDTGLFLPKR